MSIASCRLRQREFDWSVFRRIVRRMTLRKGWLGDRQEISDSMRSRDMELVALTASAAFIRHGSKFVDAGMMMDEVRGKPISTAQMQSGFN